VVYKKSLFLQFKKKGGICDRIFFFQNDFDKMAKRIRSPKKKITGGYPPGIREKTTNIVLML
jgi:hypothetical protein